MKNLGCEIKCGCSDVKMFRAICIGTFVEYYVNEIMKYDNLSSTTKLITNSVVESILTNSPLDESFDEYYDESEEEFEDE